MRLLHTSDWHLGRSLHGESLAQSQAEVLDHIVRLVEEYAVDAVLVSGDVYDRSVPPIDAVTTLAATLRRLSDHVPTVVISGNHDSAPRLGFGAELYRDTLRVSTDVTQLAVPVVLHDEHGPVFVYPIPYLDPDAVRGVLSPSAEPLPRTHEAVVAAAMDQVRADFADRSAGLDNARCVVLCHAFVVGASAREPVRSDSERDIRVGGVDSVSAQIFHGAHYVALGHLHGEQEPDGPPGTVVRYSGSPLRYSFSEAAHEKSVTIVDLDAGGVREVAVAPVPQPRPMAVLSGTLDELLDPRRHIHALDAWVQLTVTDEARPAHFAQRLRERFPHALVTRHLPASGPLLTSLHRVGALERDPVHIARDFVTYVSGAPATDAEIAVFEAAYGRARAVERGA